MAASRVNWPVITLGVAAAGLGLVYVLRKHAAAPAFVPTATPAAPPVQAPVVAAPAAFVSTSTPAQDAHDQNVVNDVLASLQQQAAPAVQQAIASAIAKAPVPIPPAAQAVAQALPNIPIPIPPVPIAIPKGFGF